MANRLMILCMTIFLVSSATAAPASAQTADDPKQPSVENPHMHFWGTDDFSSCWTHFDNNDSAGSAEQGYGDRTFNQGQQVEVSFTCRVQENFKDTMYLNPNGTIIVEVGVKIFSNDCNDQSDCTNLTLTLSKGNLEVAKQEFPSVDNNFNEEQIRWEVQVDRNMTTWNKSGEEPAITIEYSKPGVNDVTCALFFVDCTGEFWFYYYNNQDGMNAQVNFPVVNMSEATEPADPDGDNGDGGGIAGAVPGFGLTAGLGALALAAISSRSKNE